MANAVEADFYGLEQLLTTPAGTRSGAPGSS